MILPYIYNKILSAIGMISDLRIGGQTPSAKWEKKLIRRSLNRRPSIHVLASKKASICVYLTPFSKSARNPSLDIYIFNLMEENSFSEMDGGGLGHYQPLKANRARNKRQRDYRCNTCQNWRRIRVGARGHSGIVRNEQWQEEKALLARKCAIVSLTVTSL